MTNKLNLNAFWTYFVAQKELGSAAASEYMALGMDSKGLASPVAMIATQRIIARHAQAINDAKASNTRAERCDALHKEVSALKVKITAYVKALHLLEVEAEIAQSKLVEADAKIAELELQVIAPQSDAQMYCLAFSNLMRCAVWDKRDAIADRGAAKHIANQKITANTALCEIIYELKPSENMNKAPKGLAELFISDRAKAKNTIRLIAEAEKVFRNATKAIITNAISSAPSA